MAAALRSQSGLRGAAAELASLKAPAELPELGAGRPQSVSSSASLRRFQLAARAREGRRSSKELVAEVAVAEVVQVEVVGVVVARVRELQQSEPWSNEVTTLLGLVKASGFFSAGFVRNGAF